MIVGEMKSEEVKGEDFPSEDELPEDLLEVSSDAWVAPRRPTPAPLGDAAAEHGTAPTGDVTGWGPDSGGGRAPEMREKVVGPEGPPAESMGEREIKSVLKRPGGPCKPKRNVTFDESLNTFFEADYVIVVRAQEEEEEEESGVAVVPVDGCGGSCGGLRGRRRRRRGGGCVGHDGFELNIPEIFAFEPPVQFIDQVTLSPPEGYKDEGRPWRTFADSFEPARLEALRFADGECREEEAESDEATDEEKVQRYIVETITLTTVTERRIVREAGDAMGLQDKQLSGILKGGKLWKSGAEEPSSDAESSQEGVRRSVRFHDSAPESDSTKDALISPPSSSPPESTELTLTFRLAGGSNGHILLSQHPPGRPQSALRQLFPSGSPGLPDPESLRRLRSSPRSPLSPSKEEDEDRRSSSQIRRTIERNALRRSLLVVRGGEARRREAAYGGRGAAEDGGSSLVERIRQLTCGLGEEEEGGMKEEEEEEEIPRSVLVVLDNSPSSSSSSSSSSGSTYKKLAELFSRKSEDNVPPPPPPPSASLMALVGPKEAVSATTAEARKQLLSSLEDADSYSLEDIDEVLEGERQPPPDVVQVEASNESLENGNKAASEPSSGLSGVVDELALFVQRDAGRIERIRKRYSLSDTPNTKPSTTENSTSPVDPEAEAAADDYGFSKRPSVRGIKPRCQETPVCWPSDVSNHQQARRRQRGIEEYCSHPVGRVAPIYASSPPSYLREPMDHHCAPHHYPYYPTDNAERRYPPPNILHHQQPPYPPHYGHPAFRAPPPSPYYSVPPHSTYPPQYYAPRLFPSNGNNPQEPQHYHHYQQLGPYHHHQYQNAGLPRPVNYPTQGMAWVAPNPACKRPEHQERGVPEGASASPGFPTMDHQPTTTAAPSLATSTSSAATLVTSVSASSSTSSSVYYAMNV